MKKTSKEWLNAQPRLGITDPDGWDRFNYQWSFYTELITKEEFEKRVSMSTCIISRKEQPQPNI